MMWVMHTHYKRGDSSVIVKDIATTDISSLRAQRGNPAITFSFISDNPFAKVFLL